MNAEKLKEKIFTTKKNILQKLISDREDIFSNIENLSFQLSFSDTFIEAGSRGICESFRNFEEVSVLFEKLKIVNFESKLRKICNQKSKLLDKFYLTFIIKPN